jgi:threonine dehydratase
MDATTGIRPIGREQIEFAAERIAGRVRRAPVIGLEAGAFGLDCRLSLKLELHQLSGSFKWRGTLNRMLSAEIPAAGVVAASGGNFAVAVALAAEHLGVPAEIFVPESSAPAKLDRLRAGGAELVVGGDFYDDALAASRRRAEETGALFLHAFDQPEVVAGQGTCGRELAEQAPDLETVIVPTGGAGLIGGIASWYRDQVRLVSVESERTRSLHAALAAGEPVEVEVGGIAADSLGAARVGRYGFESARRWVDEAVLVSDEQIRDAQLALWRRARIACEPAPSATLAALRAGAYRPAEGERVGLIISGGNVDPAQLA